MAELWDIYDENKQPTGRTMVRNDWNMQPGDFHLTVLAIIKRPDGKYLITKRAKTKAWAAGHFEVPGGGVKAFPRLHAERLCQRETARRGYAVRSSDLQARRRQRLCGIPRY